MASERNLNGEALHDLYEALEGMIEAPLSKEANTRARAALAKARGE